MRFLVSTTLICASLFLLAASSASARTVLPVYGTDKDPRYQDECPDGAYLLGLKGNVGAWLDNISVVCGTLGPDGSVVDVIDLPPRGGGGGGFRSTACAPNEVVTVADFFRTEDYNIQGVQLLCTNLKTKVFGAVPVLKGTEDYDGDPPRSICPAGEWAKGLTIGAKTYVTGLGLICDCAPGLVWRQRYQDDKVCVPPAEQFRQADGSCRAGYVWIGVGPNPNRCVTPAERAAATAPPPKAADVFSEDAKDFHGTWRTASRGVTYDVVLRVSGSRVSGVYTSPGRPSGTITGAAKSYAGMVKLDYVWNSDAGGGSEGHWKVTTDGRLLGGYTVREAGKSKPVYYKWEGSRITRDAGEAAAQEAFDRNPTGKSVEQCAVAYQRNEARCSQKDYNYRPTCTAENAGIFATCQGLAGQAAAGAGNQAGGMQARVVLPVEVYDAANGAGNKTGDLAAGAVVAIVAEPGNDWFEVSGAAVPGGRGFVYSGEGYRSLERQ